MQAANPSPTPAPTGTAAGRRYLTLLFSDLSHSTRLGALLEAEQYGALVMQFQDCCERIVKRHGGTVARIQGDGLLAVFGHPLRSEDDVRRAAECALDLHEAVRGLVVEAPLPAELLPLSLHSGLHAGLVLVSQGDRMRGLLELAGHAPNVAARLAAEANADEILASDGTLGPERERFVTVARRQVVLRGVEQPLTVRRIVARASAGTAPVARSRTPFVGRAAERQRLLAFLGELVCAPAQHLAEGVGGSKRPGGALLQLAGGVGLGKTRLAEEFLRQAVVAGCQVHRGWCESHLIAEPLQPWLHMLRSCLAVATPLGDPAGVRERIVSDLAALGGDAAAATPTLLRLLSLAPEGSSAPVGASADAKALIALFGTLAQEAPQVLFIDDWQWADDASHKALQALHAATAQQRVLVVLARRGGPLAEGSMPNTAPAPATPAAEALLGEQLLLQPLGADEAQAAIAHLLPGSNPFVRDAIAAYTGGNPLFMEELCHAVRDGALGAADLGSASGAGGGGGSGASMPWLEMLIEARVARLPPAQATLVRSAAVAGRVIPAWLFERALGVGVRDPDVAALAAEDLLYLDRRGEQLQFKHGVARDVIYRAVGLAERKTLHQLVAGALHENALSQPGGAGTDEHCEALAYHYAAAGLPAAAAQMAERAGDKAHAASALDSAKAQYRAALAALDRLETAPAVLQRWVQVAQRLGLACVFDADAGDLPVFRRAVKLAEPLADVSTRARARYWLAYVSYGVGDNTTAIREAERALAEARKAGDDPLAVQVGATLGQACVAAAQYDRARPLLDSAIAIKRQHKSGSGLAVGLAYTLACKAALLGDTGEFDAAHALFDEAIEPVRGRDHPVEASILGLQAAVLLWQGRWADAVLAGERCRRIGAKVRSLFTHAMGRTASAYARCKLSGGATQADELAELQEASQWLLAREVRLFGSLNDGWLCELQLASGDTAAARASAARALHAARRSDWLGVGMASRAMAQAALDAGEVQRAQRWMQRAARAAAVRHAPHEAAANRVVNSAVNGVLSAAMGAVAGSAAGTAPLPLKG